ncbi:MAG: arsenic resistance protein [archaeon]|nr:arsenic resistance protein [archaeon]
MRHEALIHTVAMLLSALLGLFLGRLTDVGMSEIFIDAALGAMLYFVFVCIDGSSLRRAFGNNRFTATSLLLNFLWTPFLAFGLGLLFFAGDVDVRVGLLLCLAAPCTDWYLVFTAAARGDVAVSSAILPLNLILQIVLVPVYFVLLLGPSVGTPSVELLLLALSTLAVPLVVAVVVRHFLPRVREVSESNASTGQITFLCAAVFLMFLGCAGEMTDNLPTLVWCLVPLILFFVLMTVVARLVSAAQGWEHPLTASLTFTVLARNSPLVLAMMAPIFQDRPLVLAVLVVCPLVELPFLSAVSYVMGRRAELGQL